MHSFGASDPSRRSTGEGNFGSVFFDASDGALCAIELMCYRSCHGSSGEPCFDNCSAPEGENTVKKKKKLRDDSRHGKSVLPTKDWVWSRSSFYGSGGGDPGGKGGRGGGCDEGGWGGEGGGTGVREGGGGSGGKRGGRGGGGGGVLEGSGA